MIKRICLLEGWKKFTIDEMKEIIISVLPSNAVLVDFVYDYKWFDNSNMIVKIRKNGEEHTFLTDKGAIYHNNIMLCNSSYRYLEKEDTFSKLIEMIQNALV